MISLSLSYSSKKCKCLLKEAEKEVFDAAIVPGVPFTGDKWSVIMKARVYWAKYLYEKGIVRNVIFSGAAVHSPYCEALIMAQYAIAIGIPKQNVIAEKLAEHSTENIYYSFKLGKKLGFQRMAVVSDPFQTKLLQKFVNKNVCPSIVMIPVVYDILTEMDDLMFDPVIEFYHAYAEGFIPLKKRENFRTRFRGTRGVGINDRVYE